MDRNGQFRIEMDGKWELYDLHEVPKRFEQIYAFLYWMESADEERDSRVVKSFMKYPWRGGYSAKNFFEDLYWLTPKADRPFVAKVQYSSPGFIELALVAPIAAYAVVQILSVLRHRDEADAIYGWIQDGLRRRKLTKRSAKKREAAKTQGLLAPEAFEERDAQFIKESLDTLAKISGFKNTKKLRSMAHDDLGALKILLSEFRKIRELVEYIEDGKAGFKEPQKKDKE